jgi:(4S)-4-hydroxy-5-phosphonooxypentane-2,3-dione isomerase
MTENVYIIARLKIKEGHLEEALAHLKIAVEKTHQEEGNIQYDLHQDVAEPNLLLFYERFKDEAAFDFHNKSSHIADLVKNVVPLLDEPLKVHQMRKIS